MKKFSYLKALWSPFRPIRPKFYIGKTAIGTPYFLPRRWIKATPDLAHKAALDTIKELKELTNLMRKMDTLKKCLHMMLHMKMRCIIDIQSQNALVLTSQS